MARPASPPTVYPNSSTDHGFMPRREFIREERIPSTFALLTISSSSFIRLYGFPQPLISSIRRLLLEQERLAQGFREDIMQNFCEFVLEGKPWTNPKSIPSEKLLVDILAVFFQHGYAIVSTLDYGREQDDKVCIAFSKPTSYPSNSTIPAVLRSGGSSPSPALPPVKTPFALSFPNATTLRVVSPPLHSTPAILQAVRGAWPRGVESEKKVGDATFEFKFKGYKWFQEDTFATDSLRHVLSILASLDSFGFTLQASISIGNRSRVKDLWLFTGVAQSGGPDSPPASPEMSKTSLQATQTGVMPEAGRFADLRKVNTIPASSPPRHLEKLGHNRAVTDKATPASGAQLTSQPSLLRKAAPRAQLPISVAGSNTSQENIIPIESQAAQRLPRTSEELIRANLPSTVGSATDMTGVGSGHQHAFKSTSAEPSPAIFYSTSPKPPEGHNPYFPSTTAVLTQADRPSSPRIVIVPQSRDIPPDSVPQSPEPSTTTSTTPPALPSPPIPSSERAPEPSRYPSSSTATTSSTSTPPLLSPGAFRDSAFSSSTAQTYEIPIKWTGKDPEKHDEHQKTRDPVLPGGWASPSPVEEKPEFDEGANTSSPPAEMIDESHNDGFLHPDGGFGPRPKEMTPEAQQVKVNEPEFVSPETERKSQPVLLGEIPRKQGEPRTVAEAKKEVGNTKQEKHKSADGWVLVNVAQSNAPPSPIVSSHHAKSASEPAATLSPSPVKHAVSPSTNAASRSPPPVESSMSPAAKAIVMMDAVDAQKAKIGSRAASPANGTSVTETPSRPSSPLQSTSFRRMFGKNKGEPVSAEKPNETRGRSLMKRTGGVTKTKSLAQEEIDEKKKSGKSSRWKRNKIPPEVSQSSKRVEVD